MKAMVLKAPGSPLVLENVPDPVPGPGEAVAKVLACGAGLTIHHARAGRIKVSLPRILGHEITGEIVATGPGVTNLTPGDGVTAYFYLTCGECRWCRADRETLCENFAGYVGREIDGGYAEYIKLPARAFMKFPEGLDWRGMPAEAGVICDAIATPLKVIRRARVTPMDTRRVRRRRRTRAAHAPGRALGSRAQGDRGRRHGLEIRGVRKGRRRRDDRRIRWI
jgi:propanol-preferring alcohol dehydrogenase